MTGEKIPLCVPSLGPEEAELLRRCIDENFVSSVGPFVSQFESEFARRQGVAHAVAVSSGTAALHLALHIHDLGPGDLVAVSDFTFIASANAVRYTGADVVLVDSEPQTWNLDSAMLHDHVVEAARRGEPIPRAVEAVHILGQPAQLEPLLALSERFGISLIEDAAEALGAGYCDGPLAGNPVGSVGSVGAFSFNGNKIITTGAGGMLTTDDPALADRARHLSTQAKATPDEYFHDEVGFNYRMSNVTAALGLAQLHKLDRFVERKREIAARYDELLDPEAFARRPSAPGMQPTHWLYTVGVGAEQRDGLIQALGDAGISARSVWPPLRRQQPYADSPTIGGGVGEAIWRTSVSLPSSVDLNDEQIARVAQVANSFAGRT